MPRRPRNRLDVDREQVCALRDQGLSYAAICKATGVCYETLRKRFKEWGERRPAAGPARQFKLTREQVRELLAQPGTTTADIARAAGVSYSTAERWIARLDGMAALRPAPAEPRRLQVSDSPGVDCFLWEDGVPSYVRFRGDDDAHGARGAA